MKVFAYAVYKKLIQTNPVKATPNLVEDWKEPEKFSKEEIQLLFPRDRQQLTYIWQS